MAEILAVVIAIGAFLFGAKIGRETGHKEVITDLRWRMDRCVRSQSDALGKWGINGGPITVDYFRDSPHGIGYVDGPAGPYVLVNLQDLEDNLEKIARGSESISAPFETVVDLGTAEIEEEDVAIDSTLSYVQELDKRIAEMSPNGRDDRS